jgi:hypothetical protein
MSDTDNIGFLNNKGSMNFIGKIFTQTQKSMRRGEQQNTNEKKATEYQRERKKTT